MPELVLPADAPREGWLAARREGIAATDVAAILGLSPWESAFSLYWRKLGYLDEQPDNPAMSWGRRLEGVIADEYADRHREFAVHSGGLYRSTDRPWQLATPDRLLTEDIWQLDSETFELEVVSLLECKTAASFDGWGDEHTDEIPVYYRCQLLWQIDVMGVGEARVACVFNSHTFREYIVQRDEADLALMRDAAAAFWQRVQDGDPPGLDAHHATTGALKALHPDLDDTSVELPADVAGEYRAAIAEHKAAEARKKAASNTVLAYVGTGRYAVDQDGKVATRSVYDQTRLDTDRLRADHPDLARQYSTTSTVQKLLPAARKDKPATVREAVT